MYIRIHKQQLYRYVGRNVANLKNGEKSLSGIFSKLSSLVLASTEIFTYHWAREFVRASCNKYASGRSYLIKKSSQLAYFLMQVKRKLKK